MFNVCLDIPLIFLLEILCTSYFATRDSIGFFKNIFQFRKFGAESCALLPSAKYFRPKGSKSAGPSTYPNTTIHIANNKIQPRIIDILFVVNC